jgi:tRNA threonylcarbamoyladenosine biosynthesis protein TsaE
MPALSFTTSSPEQTEAVAQKLALTLRSGDVLILTGPLGAGKTVFVRALAEALGNTKNNVASPTYSLVHEYKGDLPLYHFDLYRLQSLHELAEIGWDDYLDRKGVVVVEWGEKLGERLPIEYYQIVMERVNETERTIELSLIRDGVVQ